MKDRLKKLSQVPLTILDGDRGTNYPNRSEFQEAGFCLFLNTSNVTKTGFDFSSTDFVSKERDTLLRKGKLRRGDIVMTTRGTIGNVAYYGDHASYEHIRINSGMVILRADAKKLDPYFLYSFLRSDLFKKQTRSQGSGSAQPQLPIGSLRNIVIPQFDFADQQDIGKVLATLDDKIELNNRINEELEGLAKLLYDYWFVQFDFPVTAAQAAAMGKPKLEGKPYRASGGKMTYNEALKREIPEEWDGRKLEEFEKNIITGKTPSTLVPEYHGGDIPFICIGDVRGNMHVVETELTLSKLGADSQRNKYIPKGAICVTCIASPGLIAFASEDSQTNQQLNSVICEMEEHRYFLYFELKQHFRFSSGAKTGNTFSNMNKGDFSAIPVLVPPDDILRKFHELVSPNISLALVNSLQNKELTELRDWLLPMLMNGQVTVS